MSTGHVAVPVRAITSLLPWRAILVSVAVPDVELKVGVANYHLSSADSLYLRNAA